MSCLQPWQSAAGPCALADSVQLAGVLASVILVVAVELHTRLWDLHIPCGGLLRSHHRPDYRGEEWRVPGHSLAVFVQGRTDSVESYSWRMLCLEKAIFGSCLYINVDA